MSDNYPLPVSCWGRTYQVSNDAEKEELFGYITDGNKALANRFRVSKPPSRWPPMKRLRSPSSVNASIVVTLRTGGTFEIYHRFGISSLGLDERKLVGAIADAIYEYNQVGCASVPVSEASAPTPERSAEKELIKLDPPAPVSTETLPNDEIEAKDTDPTEQWR